MIVCWWIVDGSVWGGVGFVVDGFDVGGEVVKKIVCWSMGDL